MAIKFPPTDSALSGLSLHSVFLNDMLVFGSSYSCPVCITEKGTIVITISFLLTNFFQCLNFSAQCSHMGIGIAMIINFIKCPVIEIAHFYDVIW